MIRYVLFLLCFFLSAQASLEKREIPLSLSVSLIVPCHSRHLDLLKSLLFYYERASSSRPDEVVVSLSGVALIDPLIIKKIESYPWRFALKILQHKEELSAAENRNCAANASRGDLLICQDADDLPHRQRIQIIKQLFETYQIDLLLHRFSFDEAPSQIRFDQAAQQTERIKSLDHVEYLAQGVPAFTREVFQRIQWERRDSGDEDCLFNYTAFDLFKNTVFCSVPLYFYRPQLSARRLNDVE